MHLYYSHLAGKSCKNREEAVHAINALTGNHHDADPADTSGVSSDPPRPPLSNVYGQDAPLLLSDIPESCRSTSTNCGGGIVLGIDEAGRGSVVGPMVYGMCFWHSSLQNKIPRDFNDSKQLSEIQRERLYGTILETPAMGFAARVLHASEISRNMLRSPESYNLNAMSHDAAIRLIRSLVESPEITNIATAYIDTVGNPESYRRRLEREFPGIDFVVESKADDKYAPCSAASIGTCTWRFNVFEFNKAVVRRIRFLFVTFFCWL